MKVDELPNARFSMTNAELAETISDTLTNMRSRMGSGDTYTATTTAHYNALLKEQERRATARIDTPLATDKGAV